MFKYYTSSSQYRQHADVLNQLKLLNDQIVNCVEPFEISRYVMSACKSPSQKKDQNSSHKADNLPEKSIAKNDSTSRAQNQTAFVQKNCENLKMYKKGQISQTNPSYFDQFLGDIQVFKHSTVDSAIKIFKMLLLSHTYLLLIKKQPSEGQSVQINEFFNFIRNKITELVSKFVKKEERRVSCSQSKQKKRSKSTSDRIRESITEKINYVVRGRSNSVSNNHSKVIVVNSGASNDSKKSPSTEKTTVSQKMPKQQQNHQGLPTGITTTKQTFLMTKILEPYLHCLQKSFAKYSHYQQLLHQSAPSVETSYQILNHLKLITTISVNFNYVGRYFSKEYAPIIHLMIEYFSKEITRLYPKVKRYVIQEIRSIERHYILLTNEYTQYEIHHREDLEIEGAPQTMMIMDELLKINDGLFHVYMGKYFYRYVQRLKIREPEWLEMSSKECAFLIHYVKERKCNQSQTSSAPLNHELRNPVDHQALLSEKQRVETKRLAKMSPHSQTAAKMSKQQESGTDLNYNPPPPTFRVISPNSPSYRIMMHQNQTKTSNQSRINLEKEGKQNPSARQLCNIQSGKNQDSEKEPSVKGLPRKPESGFGIRFNLGEEVMKYTVIEVD